MWIDSQYVVNLSKPTIVHLPLVYWVNVKKSGRFFFQIFVAVSENLNFNWFLNSFSIVFFSFVIYVSQGVNSSITA